MCPLYRDVRFIEIFSKIVWPQSKATRSSSCYPSYRGACFIVCPLYRDSVVLPKRSAKKTLAEISFHKTCTGFGWANKQGTLLLFRGVRKYFLKNHRGRSDFGVNTCYLQVFWKMK